MLTERFPNSLRSKKDLMSKDFQRVFHMVAEKTWTSKTKKKLITFLGKIYLLSTHFERASKILNPQVSPLLCFLACIIVFA